MKTYKLFSGVILISIMLLYSSCAQTVKFQNSAIVPAAQGTVKVKQDANKNYRIEIGRASCRETV